MSEKWKNIHWLWEKVVTCSLIKVIIAQNYKVAITYYTADSANVCLPRSENEANEVFEYDFIKSLAPMWYMLLTDEMCNDYQLGYLVVTIIRGGSVNLYFHPIISIMYDR